MEAALELRLFDDLDDHREVSVESARHVVPQPAGPIARLVRADAADFLTQLLFVWFDRRAERPIDRFDDLRERGPQRTFPAGANPALSKTVPIHALCTDLFLDGFPVLHFRRHGGAPSQCLEKKRAFSRNHPYVAASSKRNKSGGTIAAKANRILISFPPAFSIIASGQTRRALREDRSVRLCVSLC
jgi:hypothetical protein